MEGICGALSGAIMVAGLINAIGTDNLKTKGATYKAVKEKAMNLFSLFSMSLAMVLPISSTSSLKFCLKWVRRCIFISSERYK